MSDLIAVDEAGYGPSLGPLVIVATHWRGAPPTSPGFNDGWDFLTQIRQIAGHPVAVDDSKRVYQPRRGVDPHRNLATIAAAALRTAGWPDNRWETLQQRLWVDDDRRDVSDCPWYRCSVGLPTVQPATVAEWSQAWTAAAWQLRSVSIRFITAARLNDWCSRRGNKSDLLSSASCELAESLVAGCGVDRAIEVRCDRHGGRRYYSGVLLTATGQMATPVREGAGLSHYRIDREGGCPVHWSFTVGGDSFAPVAVSSIIAKWVRELAMARFNQFFADQHSGLDGVGDGPPPRPTAGYHVDAQRFLKEHHRTLEAVGIDPQRLIRSR